MGADITTVFEARINGTWQPVANPFGDPRMYRLFFALGWGDIGTPRHIQRGLPFDFAYPWRDDGDGYKIVDLSPIDGASVSRHGRREPPSFPFDAARHTTDADLRKYKSRRLAALRPLLDACDEVRAAHPDCDLVRITFEIMN